jgi:cytoskeletal protein RodZ
VTVGETLTEARYQAGLSIDELSERTRIRGTVIRSIEQDDYEACGGDLYVRGYVRALAGAVGIDAQPLIREYDQGRANERANGSTGEHAPGLPSVPPPAAAPTAFDLPAVTEAPAGDAGPLDLDATRSDLPVVSADPAVTAYDLPRVPADPVAAGYDPRPAGPAEPGSATAIIPALGIDPAGPGEPAGQPLPMQAGNAGNARAGTAPDGQVRGKRRSFFAVAAVVVLAAAGLLGVHLATGSAAAKNTAATAAPSPAASSAAKASAAAAASASAAARASAAAQASASAAAQASSAAAAKAAAQRVTILPVASAAAYGPDGLADGDNPGTAAYAIAGDTSQPWTSQWYVTPDFGMLKHGTGLLLDLGGKVTVTRVRLDLAEYQGADLQIRVGNDTASQDLRVAATASDVGGVVKLTLRQPTAARYLLVWFTQLPPDGAGHYQASVSRVVVTGRR